MQGHHCVSAVIAPISSGTVPTESVAVKAPVAAALARLPSCHRDAVGQLVLVQVQPYLQVGEAAEFGGNLAGSSWFWSNKYSHRRLGRLPSVDGMVPVKSFWCRSSHCRLVRVPSQLGIEPVKSFLCMASKSRSVRLASSGGMLAGQVVVCQVQPAVGSS